MGRARSNVISIWIYSSDEEIEEHDGGGGCYSDVELNTAEEKKLEDEECCILDFDPFELDLDSVLLDGEFHQKNGGVDDVFVLAERGQVACRDFPHSRHQCVTYPFDKTKHESSCPQCYCYVCDVAAPCKKWKGSAGHCHASDDSDQDNKWKKMRRAQQPYVSRVSTTKSQT